MASAAIIDAIKAQRQEQENQIFDKTKLCRFYLKGACRRGKDCTFAHGRRELVAQPDLFRTQLCLDFAHTGLCVFGNDCRFAHGSRELRRGNATKEHLGKVSSGAGVDPWAFAPPTAPGCVLSAAALYTTQPSATEQGAFAHMSPASISTQASLSPKLVPLPSPAGISPGALSLTGAAAASPAAMSQALRAKAAAIAGADGEADSGEAAEELTMLRQETQALRQRLQDMVLLFGASQPTAAPSPADLHADPQLFAGAAAFATAGGSPAMLDFAGSPAYLSPSSGPAPPTSAATSPHLAAALAAAAFAGAPARVTPSSLPSTEVPLQPSRLLGPHDAFLPINLDAAAYLKKTWTGGRTPISVPPDLAYFGAGFGGTTAGLV